MRSVIERFESKYRLDNKSGCRVWTGGQLQGYGRFYIRHATPVQAHRFAYELQNGPIPQGLEIDHLCSNKLCVNPQHLEAVTKSENIRRAWARGERAIRGRRQPATHCRHGHPYSDENTYRPVTGSRVCRACNRAAVKRYASKNRTSVTS